MGIPKDFVQRIKHVMDKGITELGSAHGIDVVGKALQQIDIPINRDTLLMNFIMAFYMMLLDDFLVLYKRRTSDEESIEIWLSLKPYVHIFLEKYDSLSK